MTSIWTGAMRVMKGLMMNYMPGMITCMQFEEFMIEYMEGTLPAGQKRVFELHMKLCRECREYMAAYKRTIEVAGQAFDDPSAPVPPDVPEDLVRAIIDARKTED